MGCACIAFFFFIEPSYHHRISVLLPLMPCDGRDPDVGDPFDDRVGEMAQVPWRGLELAPDFCSAVRVE